MKPLGHSPDGRDGVLDPVVECLTPAVATRILEIRLDATVQARADEFAAKASAGTLTDAERAEYEDLIEDTDLLGVVKALARRAVAV